MHGLTSEEVYEIVQRILSGEIDAFRAIVQCYGPELRAYLASSISDAQVVDDLLQDTFIATYEGLGRFDAGSSMRAWMYGICRNKLRMHLRALYRDRDRITAIKVELSEQVCERMQASGEDAEILRMEQLKVCLDSLSPTNRELIHARYFSKCSITELANKIQKTENSTRVILYRIRGLLKKCLEKNGRSISYLNR